jgi:acetoin:2,6-dichlorophenolindophenol oxidoreductase subunit alpha
MWHALGEAARRARAGEGPTLIEAETFRFMGHVNGDAGDYIPRAEFEEAQKFDPVPRFRQYLLNGIADETELDAIEKDITAQLDEAVEYAIAAPWPDPSELARDVLEEEVVP